MKFSSSIVFSTILGISSIGIISSQAQAITTFADSDSTAFNSAVSGLSSAQNYGTSSTNFDSTANGTFASGTTFSGNNGQVMTITYSGLRSSGLQVATGNILGGPTPATALAPQSGTKQVQAFAPDNGSATVTFSFAEPVSYFGFHLGDQHDISGQSTYSLSTNTGINIINSVQFGGIPDTTGSKVYPDTANASGSLTVGDGRYNFFGVVDDTNTFNSVTLSFSETGSIGEIDNFAFDSIVYESAVPFEFSPAMGLVVIGLGFGGLKFRQAKLNKKDLSI